MSIVTKQRGKKKIVTSSYFADLRLLRKSKYDTNMYQMRREGDFDTYKLILAYAAQELILWRKGCIELNDHISKQPNDQLKDITTEYMGDDYEEYDGPIDLSIYEEASA